jgi:hypothetical protein
VIGETTRTEDPMRTHYNRQSRREALCVRARRPRGRQLPISHKRLALTAGDDDLAEVAARIADELELTAEIVELLALSPAAALTPH